MKYLLLFLLALVSVGSDAHRIAAAEEARLSTADQEITYSGGDGSSLAQAVVIENAKGEGDGVAAEYAWLRDKFPGFKMEGQSIVTGGKDGKVYDSLNGTKADGTKATFYFDITAFFGKY